MDRFNRWWPRREVSTSFGRNCCLHDAGYRNGNWPFSWFSEPKWNGVHRWKWARLPFQSVVPDSEKIGLCLGGKLLPFVLRNGGFTYWKNEIPWGNSGRCGWFDGWSHWESRRDDQGAWTHRILKSRGAHCAFWTNWFGWTEILFIESRSEKTHDV